jgi:hypothetical protein
MNPDGNRLGNASTLVLAALVALTAPPRQHPGLALDQLYCRTVGDVPQFRQLGNTVVLLECWQLVHVAFVNVGILKQIDFSPQVSRKITYV